MRSENVPLLVRRTARADGLEITRQPSPPSAASFAATLVAPAGFAYDPAGREGLALLASDLATSGGGRRDRIELARELDRRGGILQTHCHPESAEVSIWGPEAAFRPLMEILADVVLAPRFDPADLSRVRRQLVERQLREASQPDSRAERELFRSVFPPGHPYRLTGIGNRRSLHRLAGSDVARFRRDHFSSEGSLLVVTTARSLQDVEREVRERFSDFPRQRTPRAPALPRLRPRSPRTQSIEMPGRSQVEIRIGGPSIPRSSEWYPAAYLANELLGGRPLLSRLFQRIRETHGLAYHTSSELEAMRWGGHWFAQAGTGPERRDRVVPLMGSEIERVRTEPAKAGELDAIRRAAIGEIPVALETTAGAHELAVDVAYHGLPDDFYQRWPARLGLLTPGAVRRGAEEALDGRGAATIIVGPAP